ncbi:hypothetical protein BBU29805_J27 (plasmid) [Borreliella burgdorferi 29805]|nr:hypothetical protein BBU29805_J27 [Borreliella burgdorferi 29805]
MINLLNMAFFLKKIGHIFKTLINKAALMLILETFATRTRY